MLEHVWREGAIGPLTLPHRIVMGSMHLGLEGLDDGGAALAAFYRERVRGGAGLIVTGGSAISRVGAGGRNYSFVNDDADAAKLSRVADAVHEAGGLVLLQLFHAGRYAYEDSFGLQPVAPSAVYSRYSRCEPRALSGEEVLETIGEFASGARRARELGFDGVEIMGSEGYLIDQFLAPATNLREDDWGGDAERRMRFALSVGAAVRDAIGAQQAVVYRISGASLVDGGPTLDEVLALARALAADGSADAVNVGMGWHESRTPTVQALVPRGAWTPWAGATRAAVRAGPCAHAPPASVERPPIPVIASNRINTIELAGAVLAAGEADFVSMARPFLADPEIVNKARPADGRAVNVCIACNQACIDRSIFDRRVSCVVNPRAGYELATSSPDGYASVRHVAIVGAGPAGMEAARALAAAGHQVELFEAADRIGGQFRMACRIPGKGDFAGTIAYFEAELARLGVAIHLSTPVHAPEGLAHFDAVVLATGVTPRPVDLPGADLPHVVSYAELLLGGRHGGGQRRLGQSVAIIGAGGIGVDVAHFLSHREVADPRADFYSRYRLEAPTRPWSEKPTDQQVFPTTAGSAAGSTAATTAGSAAGSALATTAGSAVGSTVAGSAASRRPAVTLMRRGTRIGERVGPSTRWAVIQELRIAGVEILTGIAYERIEDSAVLIRDATGAERRIAADTVVVAAGQEPETRLARALTQAGTPHVVIGGAAAATELDAERAFREGAQAPAAIARLLASRPDPVPRPSA